MSVSNPRISSNESDMSLIVNDWPAMSEIAGPSMTPLRAFKVFNFEGLLNLDS
jgi:hypothetical protein